MDEFGRVESGAIQSLASCALVRNGIDQGVLGSSELAHSMGAGGGKWGGHGDGGGGGKDGGRGGYLRQ